MLIHVFKIAQWYTPLLMIAIGALLWLDVFVNPTAAISKIADTGGPFYEMLRPFISNNPLVAVILSFILLIVQAIILNLVATSKSFTERYSALPGLLYLTLMCSITAMIAPHPMLFANLFLILALDRMFDVQQEEHVSKQVYNVGFLIAMASLFHYPAIFLFAALIFSVFVYYLVSVRTIIASLLGLITPFAFLALYFFLMDEFLNWFKNLTVSIQPMLVFQLDISIYQKAFIAVVGLLAIFAFLRLQLIYKATKPIRIRKRITVLLLFFLVSVASFIVVVNHVYVHFGIMLIPLSIALAVFFYDLRNSRLAEIVFSILLVLILSSRYGGYLVF